MTISRVATLTSLGCLFLLLSVAASCGDNWAGGGSSSTDGSRLDAVGDSRGDGAGPTDTGTSDLPDATPEDDAGDVAEDAGPPTGGYPAAGLVVRVVTPTAGGHATSSGSVVPVRGVLFGSAHTLRWETGAGATGRVEPGAFWTLVGVPLEPGDNTIVVSAEGAVGEASDTLVVTHNPSFDFDGAPRAQPPVLFAGEPTAVRVTIDLGRSPNFDPTTVELVQVNRRLETTRSLGTMGDDGDLAGMADALGGDARFTLRHTFNCTAGEPVRLRARTRATTGGAPYDALSAVVALPCVSRISPASCAEAIALLQDARDRFDGATADGETRAAAQQDVALWSSEQDGVDEAGQSEGEGGVWLAHEAGFLAALPLHAPGVRGPGGEAPTPGPFAAVGDIRPVGSRHTLLLDAWGRENRVDDEIPAIADTIPDATCPSFFEVDGPHTGDHATLERFRGLTDHGLVAIAASGDAAFGELGEANRDRFGMRGRGAHELVWSGEPVDCDALQTAPIACDTDTDCPSDTRCLLTGLGPSDERDGLCWDARQVDLALGRTVLGDETWGMLPAFFDAHGDAAPDSLVYVGACRSLSQGALAAALYGAGVRGVIGYAGDVTNAEAVLAAGALFDGLITDKKSAAEALTAEPAPEGEAVEGEAVDGETALRLFGDPALTPSASPAVLLDAGFESGRFAGWATAGDLRVLPRLGDIVPAEGRRFALLGTGIGLRAQDGALRQTLCIPTDRTELRLRWRVVSEELPQGCGTARQDRFHAVLRGRFTDVTLVDVAIDDLCAPAACPGCGDDYGALTDSDAVLGAATAQQTEWRQATADLRPFHGTGQVVLELTVDDLGIDTFETAVLIDAIELR